MAGEVDAEVDVVLSVVVHDSQRLERPQQQRQYLQRQPANREGDHQNDEHFNYLQQTVGQIGQ